MSNKEWSWVAFQAVLIALKLAHYISWPWLMVLAPAWIPIGVIMLMFMLSFHTWR